MTTPLPSVRSLFEQAVEIQSADARRRFLENACQGAPETRAKVEALLGCYRSAGSFLESPAADLAPIWSENVSTDRTCDTEVTEQHESEVPLDFLGPPRQPGHLGRLAHYEITEVIGRGGMGVVLKATDEKLQRVVAIKVMAPQLATSASARKRFVREAQAAAAVRNDHVVSIYAVEESQRLPYLVMECIGGVTLQQRLDQAGALDIAEVLRIGMQVAAGLAAAHAQGLIHRDIKPANILLENGVERVKITDFGLARVADDASLTQSGVLAGTPQYMSPEQAEGQSIDHRSDLFSLGSLLYAMCTGRPPFRAQGTAAVLKKVCQDTPAPIRQINPALPAGLVAVIEKLLAKSPSERYLSAEEVGQALRTELAALQRGSEAAPPDLVLKTAPGRAVVRRRPRLWAAAAAWLVLVAGGVGLSEVAGVTNFAATVIRILTPDGTLVVEVDDPQVQVSIEGDGGLSITGAGPREVRLRPGKYHVQATKDGKPVATKLVEITRGDRKVVTVTREVPAEATAGIPRLQAPPPQPPQASTASSTVGQFVVLKGDGRSSIQGAYPTLAAAVQRSSDGDTIEIRGNGPFTTEPIRLSSRLTIRAGQGFRPVIKVGDTRPVKEAGWILNAYAPLVLEGVEFRADAEASRAEQVAVNSLGVPIHLANCRFARCQLMIQRPPICEVRNSQFSTAAMPPVVLFASGTVRAAIDNNIVATRSWVSAIALSGGEHSDRIEFTRNVVLSGGYGIGFSAGPPPGVQKEAPPQLHCSRNIVVGRGGILRFIAPDSTADSMQGAELEDVLRQIIVWRDERNLYPDGAPLLTLAQGRMMKAVPTTRPYKTLGDWNQFWGLTDTSSIQGVARFQGGDLVSATPETYSPDDFRLREGSAGYRAGPDGKDLGPEIDLVGPGEAYERWKRTPEYQQWLKDTGQSK